MELRRKNESENLVGEKISVLRNFRFKDGVMMQERLMVKNERKKRRISLLGKILSRRISSRI